MATIGPDGRRVGELVLDLPFADDQDTADSRRIQPLVNPAFAPLFWIGLAQALGDADGPDNLLTSMGPVVFDMSTYPASRSAGADDRAAQAELVCRWNPATLPEGWATLDDRAWAASCTRALADWRHGIEHEVWWPVSGRADAIRRGVWPG